MEEKEVKVSDNQYKKPSYEQLEREVAGLRSMNNQLMMQIQQLNMGNLFKRLDYCFKVLEIVPTLPANLLSNEFINRCAQEIEGLMTPPEESDKSEDNE